ncbi:MAG TPA: response regulator [Burkholderiales bacterium]|nr:response regulator [Burkholderiales bacterium]
MQVIEIDDIDTGDAVLEVDEVLFASGNGERKSILQNLPYRAATKAADPKRVLVVEDNLDGVHSLVLLLREMGHIVDYAINGYAAIDLAFRLKPQFVLLDLNLPGLSGFEVCKRIKANPDLKATRVISLTAYADPVYRDRAKAAGCERHLVKPVDPAELESLLA